tara:strand:- start:156 stop:596 length:441 start_codon:yes stop_codon:yes gene_type:complete
MKPAPITSSEQLKIEIPLSLKNIDILSGLAKWSRVVGVFHIVLGILYCLSIFLLLFPTVIMGVFFILLGTRLTNASAYLNYCLQEPEEETIIHAFDNVRKYMFLNGIMFIVMSVLVLIILAVILVFGIALFDIFSEMTDSYIAINT